MVNDTVNNDMIIQYIIDIDSQFHYVNYINN